MTNRNRQRARSVHKRGNLWLPFAITGQEVTTGGTDVTSTMLARYAVDHGAEIPVGTTIGPIRATLHMHAETNGEFPVIFAAIYLVPEGGLTAPPALELEQVDAMWYHATGLDGAVNETAAGVFGARAMTIPIFSKAMRRITDIGQLLSFQMDEIATGGDVLYDVTGHVFMKLP